MKQLPRGVVWALWASAAILALIAPWPTRGIGLSSVPADTASVPPVPYTVVLQETLSKGNEKRAGLRTLTAVRADGSQVVWFEVLGETHPGRISSRRLIRLADGTRIDTDEIRRRKSTRRPATSSPLTVFRDPGIDCTTRVLTENVVGRTSIAGFDAVEMRGDGNTRWFAPSLNCAELRSKYVWPGSIAETEPVDVKAGEPSPELFETGDEYEEVRPSILYRRGPADPYGARLDRVYLSQR